MGSRRLSEWLRPGWRPGGAALALALGLGLAPGPAAAADYIVRPGDTLSDIAARAGLSWPALWRLNPQVSNPDRIRPGLTLHLPDGSGGPVIQPGMARPAPGAWYTVKPGESMARIARRHGLTWAELWLLNPQVRRPDRIRPGTALRLPAWPPSGQRVASVTAYAPTGRRTASGKVPRPGMAASNTLPFGTVVRTSAGLSVVIEDRIGCCSDLDIFMPTAAEARRFGRQRLVIAW